MPTQLVSVYNPPTKSPVTAPSKTQTPEEREICKAYEQLTKAEEAHKKHGLEFGKLLYTYREKHSRQGSRNGESFEGILEWLKIPKTTAYYWIKKYMKANKLRSDRNEVGPTKRRAARGARLGCEFVLPKDYSKDQWDKDIELLGGDDKVAKMFIGFVREQARLKRSASASGGKQSGSVN